MKKLLLLALVSALAALSMGQAAGPAGTSTQTPTKATKPKLSRAEMEKVNAEILEKLGLTEEQKTKIKTHREEMATKLKALRKEAKSGDKEATKEKVKALRKEDQDFMKTILNKQQMREMQKLRREKVKELTVKKTTP